MPVSVKPDIGMFAVTVCEPSFSTQVERPVAMSFSVLFPQSLAMVVPVTTGLPGVYRLKVPLENDVKPPAMVRSYSAHYYEADYETA